MATHRHAPPAVRYKLLPLHTHFSAPLLLLFWLARWLGCAGTRSALQAVPGHGLLRQVACNGGVLGFDALCAREGQGRSGFDAQVQRGAALPAVLRWQAFSPSQTE